jgi:hypothetical protein
LIKPGDQTSVLTAEPASAPDSSSHPASESTPPGPVPDAAAQEPVPEGWMSAQDLLANVVFATLLPAAHLTAETDLSLRELKRLAELATYKELKAQGLTMKEICDRISVSMAKVGLLSRQLKDHFARPESEYGLGRRLLMLLWAGPRSEAELLQACGDCDAERVREALRDLTEGGMVTAVSGRTVRYHLSESRYRLREEQPWMARLDALNHLMTSVSAVIWARFFHRDERALSRTLSFRARPEDLERLKKAYEDQIFPLVAEIDDNATRQPSEETVPITLSFFWSPDSLDDASPLDDE